MTSDARNTAIFSIATGFSRIAGLIREVVASADMVTSALHRLSQAPPETKSTHDPTLIGEVTLKTRSMFRKRSGRPRSEIRRTGETRSAAAPT